MSYKDKPQIKLYKYENSSFVLQAIIDDFQEVSFEHNIYEAGTFTITINYNIPNALLFQRGLFCQFGNNPFDFGEIYSIKDAIGQDGKGSQIRTITGRDARYILKRRVIKNMNSNGLWAMTDKGEIVLRNLIKDQCGNGAESKRQLPIANVIPTSQDAKGKVYSVSENFTNLYEVCKTIATQSEIGWRLSFDGALTLEVFSGQDLSQTVRFDTNYESLANGEFTDSSDAFSNAIYIGGKGQNDDRDIYEGEDGTPEGFDRFESWDNQSSLTIEAEYEAEALSMLTQYGQTLTMNGNGLAKCPYVFREQYDIGDTVTVAFSGKSAKAQILSITEHWSWGEYDISFAFGKPQNNLADQLQLMLRKIQEASNKTNSTDSVRWYTIPTDTAMPKADVTYNTIGFVGACASGGSTFTLYLDNQKTGAKTYHVYFKQLGGGPLTLTTGKAGASNLVLNSGTYVAIIYVDENGNITNTASTPTNIVEAGNTQPPTSQAVYNAIQSSGSGITVYPTQEELEQDLSNLQDGTIVGTYGDDNTNYNDAPLGSVMSYLGNTDPSDGKWLICDGRDTTGTAIELETHYPSLFMFLGGTNVLPEIFDHSRPSAIETLDITTTNQAVPYDGHIIDTCATNAGSYLYVNDVMVGYNAYSSGNRNTCVIPVRKGDLVRRSETTVGIYSAMWYKSHKIIKAVSSVDTYNMPSSEIAQVESYVDTGLGNFLTQLNTWTDVSSDFSIVDSVAWANTPTSSLKVLYNAYQKKLKVWSWYNSTKSASATHAFTLQYDGNNTNIVFDPTTTIAMQTLNKSYLGYDTTTNPDSAPNSNGFECSYNIRTSKQIRLGGFNRNSGTAWGANICLVAEISL